MYCHAAEELTCYRLFCDLAHRLYDEYILGWLSFQSCFTERLRTAVRKFLLEPRKGKCHKRPWYMHQDTANIDGNTRLSLAQTCLKQPGTRTPLRNAMQEESVRVGGPPKALKTTFSADSVSEPDGLRRYALSTRTDIWGWVI